MLTWMLCAWWACSGPAAEENWIRSGPIGVPPSTQDNTDTQEDDTGDDTGDLDTGS